MRYIDGTPIEEEDLISIYSRRIEIGEKYEVWQHPYIKNGVLDNDIDLQIICFSGSGKILSYYLSESSDRLSDPNHIGKMQLIFHDICEEFDEHIIIVKDIFSEDTSELIKSIAKEVT